MTNRNKYFVTIKFVLMAFLMASVSFAQTSEPVPVFEEAIEDNSFFIEEAYNQEAGVVQHIFNAALSFSSQKNILGTFTQEWPLWSQTHQISYTILYASLNAGAISGIGDVFVNYRYQLTGHDDGVTIAPRASVIIPVGDGDKGLGVGALGLQINLPISKRFSDLFVAHFNAGATFLPQLRWRDSSGTETKRSIISYNTGASMILLLSRSFNIMMEAVVNVAGEFNSGGEVEYFTEVTLSPGIRYAIDVESLEIVPGIAAPFLTVNGVTSAGVFLYLSFEHPF